MPKYFDRYTDFRSNGQVKPIPGLIIPTENTDKRVVYELGKSRLDRLSQEFYGVPFYGFLILTANPQFKGIEFDITDGSVISVPFPLDSALERYEQAVEEHIRLYGE